jgi:polysaccharide deacetylase 2 family uncharacterized protein YibQ
VIEKSVSDVLVGHDLRWSVVRDKGFTGRVLSVKVPSDLPVPMIHLAIQEGIERIGAEVFPSKINPASGEVTLRVGWPDSCLMKILLCPIRDLKRERGRIAIIIDDFGDRWDALAAAFPALPFPVSISIIPGLQSTRRVSQELRSRGCEILLHLPMQPEGSSYTKNPYMIHQSMVRDQVRSMMSDVFNLLPDAVGVNNHMGSLATKDRRLMANVLEEVKKRNLYFIDSRTTPETVAYDVAREMGIPCAKRDVFLDNTRTPAAVERELSRLARLAEENGEAIGIGHCNQATLEALRKNMPRLAKEGFRFVRVSELVR